MPSSAQRRTARRLARHCSVNAAKITDSRKNRSMKLDGKAVVELDGRAAPIIPRTETARKAVLVLEDGTVFRGKGLGAFGQALGEVCFNTAMTGYQEIL